MHLYRAGKSCDLKVGLNFQVGESTGIRPWFSGVLEKSWKIFWSLDIAASLTLLVPNIFYYFLPSAKLISTIGNRLSM